MELLKFKNLFLKLCKVENVAEISEVLLNVVLKNDIAFFEKFQELTKNENKTDFLQSLWQYYCADRNEKKQDFTPRSICRLVAKLSGEADSFYDCCGGSGALTIEMLNFNKNAKNIFIEELDKNVIPFLLFNICLKNVNGIVVNGNVLTKDVLKIFQLTKGEKFSTCQIIENFKEEKFEIAISNPPFNIKWQALPDERFPVLPPKNKANYAFVLNCLAKADKAVVILPNGVLNSEEEIGIRNFLVEKDLLETVVVLPGNMFDSTQISTCVLVLNKNKKNKNNICFVDSRKNCVIEERMQNGQFGGNSHTGRTYVKKFNVLNSDNIDKIIDVIENKKNIPEFSAIKKNEDIENEGYNLSPSRYIEFVSKENHHRNLQEIADNINSILKFQNSCKLIINETIAKQIGLDKTIFDKSKENSKELQQQMRLLKIEIGVEDYIQFTKNKNEFVFKCNNKELLPDIFLDFFNIWKSNIKLLNSMQNEYLKELREAAMADLMSGKIEI